MLARSGARLWLRGALFASTIAIAAFACGGGSSDDDAASTQGDATDTNTGTGTDTDTGTTDDGGLEACTTPGIAMVTDIDETLTISDQEFITELSDPSHVPVSRPDAQAMVQGYYDRGYYIVYLTARSETLTQTGTGKSSRTLTEEWLASQGYPVDPDRTTLILAPMLVFGTATIQYKTEAIAGFIADGFTMERAMGNAETDIAAYKNNSIPDDKIFIVGELAGSEGTQAVADDAWTEHVAVDLPMVDPVCDPTL